MIWPENINLIEINLMSANTAVSHLGIIITNISDNFICGEMPNHIRSVSEGKVLGIATLLHKGRSTHLWEIKITDEKKNLICASRLTMAIIEKK